MNPYLSNLNRIEFPVTYRCTGRCAHCSEAGRKSASSHIEASAAANVVKRVTGRYNITSVMTFGGEPLLYPDVVFAIHSAARECGVKSIQIITNGCFSNDPARTREVAKKLIDSGCNSVLISADAFHQKTLPLETVKIFAEAVLLIAHDKVKINPAWISGRGADNPYDVATDKILSEFEKMGISACSGNIVFPAGNALKNLSEYFDPDKEYKNPYEDDPHDIRTISIDPDGKIFGESIYKTDILKILERYTG